MKARFRDRTAKAKHRRHPVDSLFGSRIIQTFLNKFTKKGKKALARRHLIQARSGICLSVRAVQISLLLKRTFISLESPIALLYTRHGKTREVVPVPSRRNKKKSSGLQGLYNGRQQRRERDFSERLRIERLALTGPANQSSVRRAHSAQQSILCTGRVNRDRR